MDGHTDVSSRRRLLLWCAPAFAVLVWALSYLSPGGYLFLLRDYMVVEDLQFLGYLCASVMAALVAHRLLRAGSPDQVARRLGALYVVGALGLFFVAGEEVSWGQELWERILPFYPDKEQVRAFGNKQGETTLHNMGSVNYFFSLFLFAIATYGVLSATLRLGLARRGFDMPPWADYLVFPGVAVPALLVAVAYFTLSQVVLERGTVVIPGSGEEAFRRYQEVAELCIAMSLLGMTWLRLRATPAGGQVLGSTA